MKKYKLIQDYPESPEIGSIVNSAGIFKVDKKGQKVFDGTKRLKDSHLKYLKDKRYWEEIFEKDYEILSFYFHGKIYGKTGKTTKHYLTDEIHDTFRSKDSVGMLTSEKVESKNYDKDHYIHSVKRLSDSEVFTVGDIDNFGKITGFVIRENKIVSQYYRVGDWQWLSSIQHIKKPLFTTEDGVDIYKGDEYYYYKKGKDSEICQGKAVIGSGTNSSSNIVYFSTKEAAEDYALLNTACLSINDILGDCLFTNSLDSLKELVKSKL